MKIFPKLPECPKCETPEEVYIVDLSEFLFGCYLCGGRFDQRHFSDGYPREITPEEEPKDV